MPSNSTAPHAILLIVKAQVHQLMETGELSGNVSYKHRNGEHEVFRFDCQDRDLAIRKLSELLDQLRRDGFMQE